MNKLLLVFAVAVSGLSMSCAQPCSDLADRICVANGATSAQCRESRDFAERAGLTERGQCQTALKIVNSLKTGGGGAAPAKQ